MVEAIHELPLLSNMHTPFQMSKIQFAKCKYGF